MRRFVRRIISALALIMLAVIVEPLFEEIVKWVAGVFGADTVDLWTPLKQLRAMPYFDIAAGGIIGFALGAWIDPLVERVSGAWEESQREKLRNLYVDLHEARETIDELLAANGIGRYPDGTIRWDQLATIRSLTLDFVNSIHATMKTARRAGLATPELDDLPPEDFIWRSAHYISAVMPYCSKGHSREARRKAKDAPGVKRSWSRRAIDRIRANRKTLTQASN